MSAEIMRQNMMVLAATYGALEGLPLKTVSFRIYGKNDFFEKYQADAISPTVRTYFELVEKFRDVWPAGRAWPELLPIPKLGKNPEPFENVSAPVEGIG